MTKKEFIFSNKRKPRLTRHLSFWAVLCLMIFYSGLYGDSFSDVFTPDSLKQSLASLICFIPLHIISAYSFIYVLLPKYLQRKKYAAFVLAALIVALCIFISGIFSSMLFFKLLDWHLTGTNKSFAPFRTSIYGGIILAFFSTGGIVTAIKLAKGWYLQQIENTKLTKLKSDKEIQLLKAHIRPVFLFRLLDILHKKIMSFENDAPTMVLQLSELLSHFLYDGNDELISIEKELENLYLLIDIEKMNGESTLLIKISIEGNCDGKYIYPLSIFSYLQNVLTDTEKQKDDNVLDIVLNIEDQNLIFQSTGYRELHAEFTLYDTPCITGIFGNETTVTHTSQKKSAFIV